METKTPRTATDRSTSVPERPARQNFGGPRLKLHADPIPGYHLCWMNDDGSTIQDAQAAGYEFVEDSKQDSNDTGTRIRRLVGRGESGGPLYAYLMKIKDEYFKEDQKVIADHAQRVDDAIRRRPGQTVGSTPDEKFYDRGTKFETNVR